MQNEKHMFALYIVVHNVWLACGQWGGIDAAAARTRATVNERPNLYILELDITCIGIIINHNFPCCFVFFSQGFATPLTAKQMVLKSKEYES